MKRHRRPLAVLLSLALSLSLFGLAGCGKSSTTPDPGTPDPMDFPSTSDILMQNFQVAYETMSPTVFAHLIHPQSMIVLQQSTQNTFPDVGATLDRAELTDIIGRMFSKQDVSDPLGSLVPGVQTIQFQTFQRLGAWSTSLPSDVIPNTECALYSVQFLFDRGQAYSTLKVTGNIKFYVSHRDSTAAGQTRPYYQIIGQVDLTDDPPADAAAKGDNSATWGSVHALFR